MTPPDHMHIPRRLPHRHAERFVEHDLMLPRYHHIRARLEATAGKTDNHIMCFLLHHTSGYVVALLSERPAPPDILAPAKSAPAGETVDLPESIWAEMEHEARLLFTASHAQGATGGSHTYGPSTTQPLGADPFTLHATEADADLVVPKPLANPPPTDDPTEPKDEQ